MAQNAWKVLTLARPDRLRVKPKVSVLSYSKPRRVPLDPREQMSLVTQRPVEELLEGKGEGLGEPRALNYGLPEQSRKAWTLVELEADLGARGRNSEALRRAFSDALGGGPGLVLLPPGAFITEGFTVPQGVRLAGCGLGATWLGLTQTIGLESRTRLSDMTIASVRPEVAISVFGACSIEFASCAVHGDVFFDEVEDARLQLCTLNRCTLKAHHCDGVFLEACRFEDRRPALDLLHCRALRVVGCLFGGGVPGSKALVRVSGEEAETELRFNLFKDVGTTGGSAADAGSWRPSIEATKTAFLLCEHNLFLDEGGQLSVDDGSSVSVAGVARSVIRGDSVALPSGESAWNLLVNGSFEWWSEGTYSMPYGWELEGFSKRDCRALDLGSLGPTPKPKARASTILETSAERVPVRDGRRAAQLLLQSGKTGRLNGTLVESCQTGFGGDEALTFSCWVRCVPVSQWDPKFGIARPPSPPPIADKPSDEPTLQLTSSKGSKGLTTTPPEPPKPPRLPSVCIILKGGNGELRSEPYERYESGDWQLLSCTAKALAMDATALVELEGGSEDWYVFLDGAQVAVGSQIPQPDSLVLSSNGGEVFGPLAARKVAEPQDGSELRYEPRLLPVRIAGTISEVSGSASFDIFRPARFSKLLLSAQGLNLAGGYQVVLEEDDGQIRTLDTSLNPQGDVAEISLRGGGDELELSLDSVLRVEVSDVDAASLPLSCTLVCEIPFDGSEA